MNQAPDQVFLGLVVRVVGLLPRLEPLIGDPLLIEDPADRLRRDVLDHPGLDQIVGQLGQRPSGIGLAQRLGRVNATRTTSALVAASNFWGLPPP